MKKTMIKEGPARPGFDQRAEQFRATVEKKTAETLKKQYPDSKRNPPKFTFDKGAKYWRLVEDDGQGHRRVYCFLNAETGDVLKAAGWKAPVTKNPRGNVFDADFGLGGVGMYGAKYIKGPGNFPFQSEHVKLSSIAREIVKEAKEVTLQAVRTKAEAEAMAQHAKQMSAVKDAYVKQLPSGQFQPVMVMKEGEEWPKERERQERDKEDYLRQQQTGVKDESLTEFTVGQHVSRQGGGTGHVVAVLPGRVFVQMDKEIPGLTKPMHGNHYLATHPNNLKVIKEDSWSYRKHDARVAEGTRARLFAYDLAHGVRVEASTVYNGKNWRRSPIQLEISQNGKMVRNESHANRRLANESFRRLKRKLREITRSRRQLKEKNNGK